MTLTPNDVFQIPPSTALEMAQGVMLTLNTIIRHLPERELREMRSSLEVSLCVVEDLLLGGTISSSFETLTINGVTTTPSCVFTVANPRTAVTADSPPPLLPASVAADCGVVSKPASSCADKQVPAPPPPRPRYTIIKSSRPNVGQPDYKLHPPFVKPGVPGPYTHPPVDPSKGDPIAYYVITKGLYIGIFTSWPQCSPWVTKVAGNAHFKVLHWVEAMEAYNSCLEAGGCEVLS